jgi:YggT family protein
LSGVSTLLPALDAFIVVLRTLLLVAAAIVAVLATVSYVVRTRRVSPFGSVARMTRSSIDPLFAPVERRIVRFGARPATAPWWTLAVVVIGAIVLLSAMGFLREQLLLVTFALQLGSRGLARLLVSWTFGLLQLALLVQVVASWVRANPTSWWVRWSVALTDWLLRPLRRVIPPIGMMDVSPIAAYFILLVLERVVLSLF